MQTRIHAVFRLTGIGLLLLQPPTPVRPRLRRRPRRGEVDRQALVTRHNIVPRHFDANNPLTAGNGEFAFTVDATGLQTFPEAFEHTTPIRTLSDWGWHTIPNTNGWSMDTFQFKEFADLNGRQVPCADVPGNNQTPEIKWLRANPHRLHLGQIGFRLTPADGSPARTNDLIDIEQTLDLWNGLRTSHFKFDGQRRVFRGGKLDEERDVARGRKTSVGDLPRHEFEGGSAGLRAGTLGQITASSRIGVRRSFGYAGIGLRFLTDESDGEKPANILRSKMGGAESPSLNFNCGPPFTGVLLGGFTTNFICACC